MAAFVFKVLQLAIRTASKPLANRFQSYVLEHPYYRPKVLKFGQQVHALEFAMNRLSEMKSPTGAQKFVAALEDEAALNKAGAFVSEGFILAVGVGVIYWDYRRGVERDAQKAEKEQAYKQATEDRFLRLEKDQKDLTAHQDAIMNVLLTLRDQSDHPQGKLQNKSESTASSGSWWRLY